MKTKEGKRSTKRWLIAMFAAVLLFTGVTPVFADEEQELVIVIDPGHDSTHMGASANGIREHSQYKRNYLRILSFQEV